jgi:hypothetical protein
MEDLHTENYKTILKEIGKDTNKWKNMPCSWIGRIKIIKMSILLEAIYKFNAIPTKITMSFFFQKKREKILKICMESQNTFNS